MDGNFVCSALDQSGEPCADVRMFDLQKGSFNQIKPAALANAPSGFAHVFVGFLATAAVSDNQHSAIYFSHAAAPASANVPCAQ
jgi:hypothetical protein